MGAGHCVVRLVACLVGRECTRESNVVRDVRYIESMSLQLYVITFLIGFLVNGSYCLCPNLGSLESRFAAKPTGTFSTTFLPSHLNAPKIHEHRSRRLCR